MEITEQVKYGNRIVKCVRAEVVEAIGQDGQEANRLKPDFSLADEYESLKLIKQARLARKRWERYEHNRLNSRYIPCCVYPVGFVMDSYSGQRD